MDPNSEIYKYSDYRLFLREYFASQKKAIPGFSYRLFAVKIGFSSPAFFKLVADGKKNLSKESAFKLSRAMGLNVKAADFFENLVFFNQSKDIQLKSHYLERLQKQQPKNSRPNPLPAEYVFLQKWFYAVIREMVDLHEFKEDPEWISQKLKGKINSQEAAASIKFLLDNGFWMRKETGKLTKRNVAAGATESKDPELASALMRHFCLQMLDLAKESVVKQSGETRSLTSTLCLSRQGYEQALEKMARFRKEMQELAASDWIADRVYQLNLNFFPLSDSTDNG